MTFDHSVQFHLWYSAVSFMLSEITVTSVRRRGFLRGCQLARLLVAFLAQWLLTKVIQIPSHILLFSLNFVPQTKGNESSLLVAQAGPLRGQLCGHSLQKGQLWGSWVWVTIPENRHF